jgi:hypothetical protein
MLLDALEDRRGGPVLWSSSEAILVRTATGWRAGDEPHSEVVVVEVQQESYSTHPNRTKTKSNLHLASLSLHWNDCLRPLA